MTAILAGLAAFVALGGMVVWLAVRHSAKQEQDRNVARSRGHDCGGSSYLGAWDGRADACDGGGGGD